MITYPADNQDEPYTGEWLCEGQHDEPHQPV